MPTEPLARDEPFHERQVVERPQSQALSAPAGARWVTPSEPFAAGLDDHRKTERPVHLLEVGRLVVGRTV
jgi:hypothetical protein